MTPIYLFFEFSFHGNVYKELESLASARLNNFEQQKYIIDVSSMLLTEVKLHLPVINTVMGIFPSKTHNFIIFFLQTRAPFNARCFI